MKFKVDRDVLLKPLQFVSGVVERKQTLPILANVLMTLNKDELSLICSDSELEVIARLKVDTLQEGSITVPARKLTEICKTLPAGSIIDLVENEGKFILSSGRSRFSLATLPAHDFPTVDSKAGVMDFHLPRPLLRQLLDQTAFAMAVQDVRYYLNGLLMEMRGNELRVVATDGHRLALAMTTLPSTPDIVKQVIIPRKGVQELSRIFSEGNEDLSINLNGNHICVQTSEISVTSKLIDGRYPDYERVIPPEGKSQFVANREEFKQALQRAAILSNEKYRGVRLSLTGNNLVLNTNNPDQEAAEEQIIVEYSGPDDVELGFNVNYLLDVLSVLKSEKVRVSIAEGSRTAILKSTETDNALYIVMPMKM